jgi:hypothetical protein
MTSRTSFTDEEWERLGRSPFVAAVAITLADPGGPIEAFKETNAALKAVLDAAQNGTHGEFVQAVARDVAEKARHRHNPLANFKPDRARPREDILDEMRAVNALLVAKTTPEETDQFRDWLRAAAQGAALAAKEGGFLGIHAERVSEREQQMLEDLGAAFGDAAEPAAGAEGPEGAPSG